MVNGLHSYTQGSAHSLFNWRRLRVLTIWVCGREVTKDRTLTASSKSVRMASMWTVKAKTMTTKKWLSRALYAHKEMSNGNASSKLMKNCKNLSYLNSLSLRIKTILHVCKPTGWKKTAAAIKSSLLLGKAIRMLRISQLSDLNWPYLAMQQRQKLASLKVKLTRFGQKLMANVVLQTQTNLSSGSN